MSSKRLRVIEQLRIEIPGVWWYEPHERCWIHESGIVVCAYAQLTPRHADDGDSFTTIYRRIDTGRQVLLTGSDFLPLSRCIRRTM